MIMIGLVRLGIKTNLGFFYDILHFFEKPLQGSLFNFDLFIATVGESLH